MELKRTNIQLTASQHAQIRRLALEQGISMSEWLRRAAEERLRKELGTMARRTRQEISDATGFDHADPFTSEEQVREYFTIENMKSMFGECELTQDALDEMAEDVIYNGWHMARECDVCSHAGQYTAATRTVDGKHLCDVCAAEVEQAR